MKAFTFSLALLTFVVCVNSQWQTQFDFFACYDDVDPVDLMSKSLDTLIAMLEKYEENESQTNFDDLAEMLVGRYRRDGIIYDPISTNMPWQINQDEEADKQDLLLKILGQPSQTLEVDSFTPREECGLHMMLSHSTDAYRHEGVEEIWDNSNWQYRNKRSTSWFTNSRTSNTNSGSSNSNSGSSRSNSGSSRSNTGSSASNTGSFSSNSGSSASNTGSFSSNSGSVSYASASLVSRTKRNTDPLSGCGNSKLDEEFLADHPLEFGVIETPYGPVAGGTLLTGIMALSSSSEVSISTVLGDDADYMPSEMRSKTINKAYAAALAGDLGQMALLTSQQDSHDVGPIGRYSSCSTCAQLFSYSEQRCSYLSRAELFAGIDVLLLYHAYQESGGSSMFNELSLSQILRYYYSDKGLPGMPQVKACNRKELYQQLDQDMIFEQALHFTYAYQNYFETSQNLVNINNDDFPSIEATFSSYVDAAKDDLDAFMNGYNSEEDGYSDSCYYGGSSTGGSGILSNFNSNNPLMNDGMADIVAVYSGEGSDDESFMLRQIIVDSARRMGISTYRSSLQVYDRTGTEIGSVSNSTNFGDWACNFTKITESYGSRADMSAVLENLSRHYYNVYRKTNYDASISSGNSQIVFWQVPSTFPDDVTTFNRSLLEFRANYPDVNIIFFGRESRNYVDYLEYEDDFIVYSTTDNYYDVLDAIVFRFKATPRFFVYPGCDPNNNTLSNNLAESSHEYKGYVYSNYTTYITIPAKNFIFSETLKIKVSQSSSSSGDIRACFSRTNRYARDDYEVKSVNVYRDNDDDWFECVGGPDDENEEEVTLQYLCNDYAYQCNPIHISITSSGASGSTFSSCDEECEFPNQIQYTITHEGMICGTSCLVPATALLLLCALLQKLLQ